MSAVRRLPRGARVRFLIKSNMTAAGNLVIYNSNSNFVEFDSGSIDVAGLNFNGRPDLFAWIGGALNIHNNVTFDSAAAATSTAAAFGSTLLLLPDQTLKITGTEQLGGAGPFSLFVNGGKHTVSEYMFVNPSGSLSINGGGLVTVEIELAVGESTSTLTSVSVSGMLSSLEAKGWMNIGDFGKGALNIMDHATATSPGIFVVQMPPGVGQLNVSGADRASPPVGLMWEPAIKEPSALPLEVRQVAVAPLQSATLLPASVRLLSADRAPHCMAYLSTWATMGRAPSISTAAAR